MAVREVATRAAPRPLRPVVSALANELTRVDSDPGKDAPQTGEAEDEVIGGDPD